MNSAPILEILVVDDDITLAEEYSRLIQQATGLGATFTDEPKLAIDITVKEPITVVVLDQRMPTMVGTSLFREMVKRRPSLKAILVTGEASKEELAEAWDLGIHKYLDKQNVSRSLPAAVLHQHSRARDEILSRRIIEKQPEVYRKRSGFLWRRVVSYRVLDVRTVVNEHIFDDSWRELMTIQAGQTERQLVRVATEQTVVVEDGESRKLGSSLGLKRPELAALTAGLTAELSRSFKNSATTSTRSSSEVERTFRLPEEPSDINQLHTRARRIQQAPVYNELSVMLVVDCECCKRSSIVPITVFRPTESVALRHIDQLSDGSSRVVTLGVTPGS